LGGPTAALGLLSTMILLQRLGFRIGLAAVTLLAVSAIIFTFSEVLPGDIAARVLGRMSTPQQRALFRERLHLNRPVYERYGIWLKGAVQGDFGRSLVNQERVATVVGARATATFALAAYAFLLSIPVTLLAATFSALFRNRLPDSLTSFLTLVGFSLPEFVLGTLLIFVFAVSLSWFPALSFIGAGMGFWAKLHAITLPAVTLMVPMAAYATRMLRDNLIEVLDSEYVRMATLKGVQRWRIVLRHALPSALGPALNVTALNLTYLIGGVVVVEQVFSYDGLGRLLVDAISNRDTPVVEAVTLLASAVYIGANMVADVLVYVLNPRLRTA
jgi:peptide/nickel transport system permease protein